jgi:hypothetical protein
MKILIYVYLCVYGIYGVDMYLWTSPCHDGRQTYFTSVPHIQNVCTTLCSDNLGGLVILTLQPGCQMVCFQTKNPNLGTFWRVLQWKMLVNSTYGHLVHFYGLLLYFMDIWYILWSFWYIFCFLAALLTTHVVSSDRLLNTDTSPVLKN